MPCFGLNKASGETTKQIIMSIQSLRRSENQPRCWPVRRWLAVAMLIIVGGAFTQPVDAQPNRLRDPNVISQIYFRSFLLLYNGDYDNALKAFREALRSGIQTVDARWIDSICYHTMNGETHYRRGELRQAMEHYDAALRLYLQYPDWMMRVQFPARVEPQPGIVKHPTWGRSKRRFRLGRYPSTYNISRGGLRVTVVQGRPAVTNQQQLHPLHVAELVRCTTLAITRRSELLGPLSKHDKLAQTVLNTLSARPGPANHWAQCWIDLQLGVAFMANDKKDPAVKALVRSLVAGGEFDHPLTCVAMLELGKIAMNEADHRTAANFFEEAAYSAHYFDRPEVIEEALRLRHLVHVITGAKGFYTPLVQAANWANVNNFREIQSSLLIVLTENYALGGDMRRAQTTLSQAIRTATYRDISRGWLSPMLNYVTALVQYHRGSPQSGDRALAAAMQYQKASSIRLFQIARTDAAYVNGHVRERSALELYQEVLHEPTPDDWRRNPIEAFSVLLHPQPAAMEHLFDVAIKRNDVRAALDVVDRMRRQRFFSTLQMGGRLLGLRWIMQAPASALSQEALQQRDDIAGRYPDFGVLQKQALDIQKQLAERPLLPTEPNDAIAQAKLVGEVKKIGMRQEDILRKVAIGREPASLVFPALTETEYIQKQLRVGEAVLVLHVGKRNDHAFFVTSDKQKYWQIKSKSLIRENLIKMLRAMGHYDQRRELTTEQLTDAKWRDASAALLNEIVGEPRVDLGDGVKDLIIVPAGIYWYIPFEALQVGTGRQAMPLIYKTRVRYAPTMALTIPDTRGRKKSGDVAVVQGRLYPREMPELGEEGFQAIRRIVPRAHAIKTRPLGPTSALATLLDGLVVLDDLEAVDKTPFDLAPFQVDRGKPGSTIGDWMLLPWGSPEVVVLPGFHAPAEESLKRSNTSRRPGDELFMTTMGLLASGTRTVLISRWRTGGRTANNLICEFLQELPETSAQDSWQRSVLVAVETPIDAEFEPRVKFEEDGPELTASHPFFWSGYLLVDPGNDPAAKNVAEPKQN